MSIRLLTLMLICGYSVTCAEDAPVFFYVGQKCRFDNGKRSSFNFVTRIFHVPSRKWDGNIVNEAYSAMKAMIAGEEWDCSPDGEGIVVHQDPENKRDEIISWSRQNGWGVVEWAYQDGARRGAFPRVTVRPK